MFKTGEFSKLSQLTVRALRHYEEEGLLVPTTIDADSGYRYYYSNQLIRVNEIKMLLSIGLTLKEVKDVLDKNIELDLILKGQKVKISETIDMMEHQLNIINYLEDDTIHDYDIVLKKIPKRKVMSLRTTINSYYDEYKLWDSLYKYIEKYNESLSTPLFGMTIYHDLEHKETDIDIEVQSDVSKLYPSNDLITFYEMEEFMMASIIFKGSYQQINKVVEALAKWIEVNGYQIIGPMINIPHKSPKTVDNESEYLTEAGYIVERKLK